MKQVPPLPLMEFGGKERRRGGKAVAAAGGKMSARSPASRDPTADRRNPTNQNQGKNQFAPREARLTCQLGSCKSPSFSTVSIHQQVRNASKESIRIGLLLAFDLLRSDLTQLLEFLAL